MEALVEKYRLSLANFDSITVQHMLVKIVNALNFAEFLSIDKGEMRIKSKFLYNQFDKWIAEQFFMTIYMNFNVVPFKTEFMLFHLDVNPPFDIYNHEKFQNFLEILEVQHNC